MAIFRTGALAAAISGTVGGVVFVAGAKSNVVRPRPLTRFKTSPFLADSRARLHNYRNAWRTLSTLQQQAWRTAASSFNTTNALGASSPLAGFALFIKVNSELRAIPGAIVEDPGDMSLGGVPTSVAADFSASGTYEIQANPPGGFGTAFFFVYGWPFWRDYDARGPCRLVFLESDLAASITLDLKPTWETHFGPVSVGQRICVGVAAKTGPVRRSDLVVVQDTVVA